MYYLDLFRTLNERNVRYLVVGGLAVNLYGVPRVTQDVDVIIAADPQNISDLIDALDYLGYVSRLPVDPAGMAEPDIVRDWVENRNLIAFNFVHRSRAYQSVDIVLHHPLDFEAAWSRCTRLMAGAVPVCVASVDDLITMKRASGRKQDLCDIELLQRVIGNELR